MDFELKLGGIASRIRHDAEQAEFALKSAVLSSCEPFVPYYTGELFRSGMNSEDGVMWIASHASKCYYADREFSKKRHPRACARWFEAARAESLDKWIMIVKSQLGVI